jgi:hypothetical protein
MNNDEKEDKMFRADSTPLPSSRCGRGIHTANHISGAKFLMESLAGMFRFSLPAAARGGRPRRTWLEDVARQMRFSEGDDLDIWIIDGIGKGKDRWISKDNFMVYIQVFLPESKIWKKLYDESTWRLGEKSQGEIGIRVGSMKVFYDAFVLDTKYLQKSLVNIEKYLFYLRDHGENLSLEI